MSVSAEDHEDIEAYHRFKERLAHGEEELIPAEFVNRMLDGESSVKVWREFRGMTVQDLADRAGVSAAHILQIETGDRASEYAIDKIAAVLGVTVEDL